MLVFKVTLNLLPLIKQLPNPVLTLLRAHFLRYLVHWRVLLILEHSKEVLSQVKIAYFLICTYLEKR